jgi:predicted permease
MMTDLRSAFRQVLRRPAFLALGATALGVGLAAVILVFGIVNTLLFRPQPGISDADRLVEVGMLDRSGRFDNTSSLYFRDLAESARTLDLMFAYRFGPAYVNVDDVAGAESALVMLVSGEYFSALGVQPLHGQLIAPTHDSAPGREAVIVLSEAGFNRHLGGDPAAIGRAIRVNGSEYTVIGVTASGFGGHMAAVSPEFYVPLSMAGTMRMRSETDLERRESNWLRMGGRLAQGATLSDAQAEFANLSAALAHLSPNPQRPREFGVAPLRPMPQAAQGFIAFISAGLMVMCAAILALACTNLAGVLLAQGQARIPELAMRSALGASRARITRQLMLETFFVALAACTIGLSLTSIGRDVLNLLTLPVPFPVDLAIAIDWRVVSFAIATAGLVALAVGLVPALRIASIAPASVLGSAGGTVGGHAVRTRPWLLAVQSALTVALLMVACLTALALSNADGIDTGFRTERVYTASVDLTPLGLPNEDAVERIETLMDQLRLQGGVEHASFASVVPLTMSRLGYGDAYLPGAEEGVDLDVNTVGAGFFEVFALPVRGRAIDRRDRAETPPVAVVNERLARNLFGEADPLGREFEMVDDGDRRRIQVVGVVPDGRYSTLTDDARAFAFLPATQRPRSVFELFVHGPVDPVVLQRVLVDELHHVLPDVPNPVVHRFADMAALSLLPQRILGTAATVLGVIALVLAATGIYGVLAFQVGRRYREFGVRRALGASDAQVATALLRRTVAWLAGGAMTGLLLAQLMASALGDLLFGVGGSHPVALSATLCLFTLMVAVAVVVPLRRLLGMEPTTALRYE